MINIPKAKVVTRIGVDFAKPGSCVTVTGAHMRIKEHTRIWILGEEFDLDTAVMHFRFDVLELEMHKAFDELRLDVLCDISQMFWDYRLPRDVDHQLFMEQN